jgi:hypothetical protein
MHRVRIGLAAIGMGLTTYFAPVTAVSAQPSSPPTFDGQTLGSQNAATQQLFQNVWGGQAVARWASEHNGELIAKGYVPGSGAGTSGAQTSPPGQSSSHTSGAPGSNISNNQSVSAPGPDPNAGTSNESSSASTDTDDDEEVPAPR